MNWKRYPQEMPIGNTHLTAPMLVTVSDGGDPYYGEQRHVTEAYFRFDTKSWYTVGGGMISQTVTHFAPMPEPAEEAP